MLMKYSPVHYRLSDTDRPLGAFTTDLGPDGWLNAKFDPAPDVLLMPDEIEEFVSLVHSFYKEFKDRKALDKFVERHCKQLAFDGFNRRYACRFDCDLLDYNVEFVDTHVTFYPFRKENAQ